MISSLGGAFIEELEAELQAAIIEALLVLRDDAVADPALDDHLAIGRRALDDEDRHDAEGQQPRASRCRCLTKIWLTTSRMIQADSEVMAATMNRKKNETA